MFPKKSIIVSNKMKQCFNNGFTFTSGTSGTSGGGCSSGTGVATANDGHQQLANVDVDETREMGPGSLGVNV